MHLLQVAVSPLFSVPIKDGAVFGARGGHPLTDLIALDGRRRAIALTDSPLDCAPGEGNYAQGWQ
jgi:hypothetical protein